MKSIFKTFLLSLLVFSQVHFAYAQTAAILPLAKTQFTDSNGKPLTSGTVDFYIPSTTTRKTTWQDAAETIPNTNPVVLDGAGRALILGSGSYRQVVKDRNHNTIWDQVTSSTGSGGSSPTATGDGDLVGTVKPWAGLTAPNQYMLTYGQEVSRTTYAPLLAAITSTQSVFCTSGSPILTGLSDTTNFPIGAKVEISCVVSGTSTIVSKTTGSVTLAANSNINLNTAAIIYPWGNGNGSTTFNVPDYRGFVIAGNNNMGGVPSSILTTQFFGSANPNSIGGAGGNQSATLITSNLPPYTPAGTITNGHITSTPNTGAQYGTSVDSAAPDSGPNLLISIGDLVITSTQATSTFTGNAQGGTSTPISLIQPTKTSNYIIKVTPDTNSATASGVTSLGGMTGDIACGSGLTCTGNTITVNVATSSAAARTTIANTTNAIATPLAIANGVYAQYLALNITHNQIPSFTIDVNAFHTTGYTTPGDGGDGWYIKSTSAGACPIQDAAGQYWALDPAKLFPVMACGALLDGIHPDDTPFQAALNAAAAVPDPGFGTPGGGVSCPVGKLLILTTGVTINNPITLDCPLAIYFGSLSGDAIAIGKSIGRSQPQNYSLKIRSITCATGSGTSYGVHVYLMNFSLLEVGQIQNCLNANFYCDGTGSTHTGQVIQHNTFNLGQIVNSPAYGILLDSLNPATSSCEANVWNVQNSYQNNINLQVDKTGHTASTSNTFNMQSMDNATTQVADIFGSYNVFNLGFYQGTVKIETGALANSLYIGNTTGTGAVVSNSGGTSNRCYQAGVAPAAC